MPTVLPRKTLGKGSQLSIGTAGSAGPPVVAPGPLTTFGRIETVTLPQLEYATADEAPELVPSKDDGTLLSGDPVELGDAILGESSFTAYADLMHAQHQQLIAWWKDKTELAFQLDSPQAVDASRGTWTGKLKTIAVQQLSKTNYWKIDVTIVNTGDFTIAAKP